MARKSRKTARRKSATANGSLTANQPANAKPAAKPCAAAETTGNTDPIDTLGQLVDEVSEVIADELSVTESSRSTSNTGSPFRKSRRKKKADSTQSKPDVAAAEQVGQYDVEAMSPKSSRARRQPRKKKQPVKTRSVDEITSEEARLADEVAVDTVAAQANIEADEVDPVISPLVSKTAEPSGDVRSAEAASQVPSPDMMASVIGAIESNGEVLVSLVQQITDLQTQVAAPTEPTPGASSEEFESLCQQVTVLQQSVTDGEQQNESLIAQHANAEYDLRHQVAELQQLVADVEQQNEALASQGSSPEVDLLRQLVTDLEHQLSDAERRNSDLQSQVNETRSRVPATVAIPTESLTWEARKELMLQQMEDESFDAESFIAEIQTSSASEEIFDPTQYVSDLNAELERQQAAVEEHANEISDLKQQLEQRSEPRADSIDPASSGDSDDFVHEGQAKLIEMQQEWEARFRDGEIKASLERAKISRERCELAQRNAELEEQLAHFRRETEESRKAGGGGSRRWAAKLGLTCD